MSSLSPATHLLQSQSAFIKAIPLFERAAELSLDTEFHTERSYHPKLMLLQLRPDEGDIFLLDPLTLDLGPLASALSRIPLLVHGGQADLQIIKRLLGVVPSEVFDTQVAAGWVGQGYPTRLQELVFRNIGETLDKTWTLSDWSRRPLSPEQLRYAADDVRILPGLARALRMQLQETKRQELCRQATESIFKQALRDEDPEMLWRQVHGWNSLDAAGLGALKRLAQWRDRTAEERDLPRNYLLTDALLVDTARRRPDSMETLLANRRFPAQLGKRDGKALITLLEQSPPMAIPPSFRLQQDLLKIAACLNEASSGISAELLLPEPVLYAFMQTGELELWRQEGVGDDFFNFLSGKKLIAMPGYLREKEEKEKA